MYGTYAFGYDIDAVADNPEMLLDVYGSGLGRNDQAIGSANRGAHGNPHAVSENPEMRVWHSSVMEIVDGEHPGKGSPQRSRVRQAVQEIYARPRCEARQVLLLAADPFGPIAGVYWDCDEPQSLAPGHRW